MEVDLLIHSARQLLTCASPGGAKRGAAMRDVGLCAGGAVAVAGGRIVATGPSAALRAGYSAAQTIDASGKVVCPGFVDAHTHVVFAGERIDEFAQRVAGTSYLEIMAAGGGIAATTRACRTATLDELVAATRPRLAAMRALGTTTAEVKSGYGLDTATELKLLETIAVLDQEQAMDLVPTFLGAHALPPEYRDRPDAFVACLVHEMLPAVAAWYRASAFAAAGVPLFADVFCEQNAFSVAQSRLVLAAAHAAGLPLKAHVDEFTELGGLSMALDLSATSVDHLDVTGPDGIARLAASRAVGVLLPAVSFNLGGSRFAAARAMIDAGAAVALSTDFNPGSAPCPSMPLVMAIACRYLGMSPAEALTASTINAAYAIGLGDGIGSLEAGKWADILVLDAPDYRYLAYEFGGNRVAQVVKRGRVCE